MIPESEAWDERMLTGTPSLGSRNGAGKQGSECRKSERFYLFLFVFVFVFLVY